MTQLLAFHNDPKIQKKYIDRVKAHYKADEIVQGIYWENGKGCAVGCTIQGSDHSRYETELGIPQQIAILEDVIFEELKNGKAKEFPLRFIKAVKIGSDLSKVTPQLVIWQFEDKKYGLKHIKEIKDDKEVFTVCEDVVNAYKRVLAGETVTESEWEELYQKADKLARAGAGAWARAGARAWAWAGAGAGARAWAGAGAWAGAWAGARAWADYDHFYEEYINALADKFISLIEEAE